MAKKNPALARGVQIVVERPLVYQDYKASRMLRLQQKALEDLEGSFDPELAEQYDRISRSLNKYLVNTRDERTLAFIRRKLKEDPQSVILVPWGANHFGIVPLLEGEDIQATSYYKESFFIKEFPQPMDYFSDDLLLRKYLKLLKEILGEEEMWYLFYNFLSQFPAEEYKHFRQAINYYYQILKDKPSRDKKEDALYQAVYASLYFYISAYLKQKDPKMLAIWQSLDFNIKLKERMKKIPKFAADLARFEPGSQIQVHFYTSV